MSWRALRVIFVAASLLTASQLLAQTQSDLAVSKNGPATTTAGANVDWDVFVTNTGPDDATGTVTLTDDVPAGMTFVSATQNSGPAFSCSTPAVGGTGTISCTVGSMLAGESADFTFTMKVDPSATPGTFFVNTANVNTATDLTDENNSSSAGTSIPPNFADVAVTKTGPSAASPDTDVSYSITVTNAGPSDANNVTLTDTLPGDMTFVSLTQNSGPTFNCTTGTTSTCTIDPLTAGSSATFTLVGHIPSGATSGTTYSNTASVTSANDPNPENDAAISELTVSSVDLSVSKSGPATGTAGQQISYTIGVANAGPDTALNVQLDDVLPTGTTFASINQNTGPVFICTGPPPGFSGVVTCTITTLASSASATFTLTLNIDNTFIDGATLTNTATISSSSNDTNTNNDSSSTSATITGVTDVSVTKTGPTSVLAGVQLSWDITVQNLGVNAAANTQLSDTIPAGTTFVSMQQVSGPSFSCSGTSTVTCTNPSFAAGATATFQLTVSIPSNATGSISNTANVSTTTADTNAGNDSSTANATITQQADLSVTKTGPTLVAVGTDVAYTITVSSAGPSDASNVTLSDAIPAGTTFVSMQQNSGPSFNCSGTTTVTCTIATLTPASTATFTLTVNATTATSLSNTANVSTTTTDPNAANNSSTANTTAALPDLTLTKTVSNGPYIAGNPVTFTLTVNNAGTVPATNVVVTDVLPAGMSATSTTPPGACTGTTTVTCTAATLAAGGSVAFTITANLPMTPGNYSNTATVSSATTDSTPANNTSSAGFAVVPPTAIPTLSPEVLLLLAALLGFAAVVTLKR